MASGEVAYLGPEGSFTHQAAAERFAGNPASLRPYPSISAAFEALRSEAVEFAVAPVESLRQGPVIETYMELKSAGPARIVGEAYLPIQLYLILHPDAELDSIRSLRSKAEALRQCGHWIEGEQARRCAAGLPPLEVEAVGSTAKAAAHAAEHPDAAAISSRFVEEFYRVKVVGRGEPGWDGIQDLPDGDSYTRFLALGRSCVDRAELGDDRIKTSLAFMMPHRPGALVDVLLPFRNAAISLEDIQPMPFRATRGQIEYVFFMDFAGHFADDAMRKAVHEAEETCVIDFLGSYPCAEMPRLSPDPSK